MVERTMLAVVSEMSASSVASASSTTATHRATRTSDGRNHVIEGTVGHIHCSPIAR